MGKGNAALQTLVSFSRGSWLTDWLCCIDTPVKYWLNVGQPQGIVLSAVRIFEHMDTFWFQAYSNIW